MLQVTFRRAAADAAGKGLLRYSTSILPAAGLLAVLAACAPGGPPVDLVEAAKERMGEGSVAGRDRGWVMSQTGKQVRCSSPSTFPEERASPSRAASPRSGTTARAWSSR